MQVRDAVILSIGIITVGAATLVATQGGWEATRAIAEPSALSGAPDTPTSAPPEVARRSGVSVQIAAEHGLLSEEQGRTLAMIEIEAQEQAGVDGSDPVSLVVVLDASGSMEGNKMDNARFATRTLASMLRPQDQMSVVSFSSGSTTWLRGWSPEQGMDRLSGAVDAISVGGGTCVSCGLEEAFQVLQSAPALHLRRVVLLSDGEANEGRVDSDSLRRLAQDGLERFRAVTSTVALGSAVDAPLLAALSNGGEGGYYFVRNSAALTEVLEHEASTFVQAMARSMILTVEPLAGASIDRDDPMFRDVVDGVGRIHVGRLSQGQRRRFLVPLRVPLGSQDQIVRVSVQFQDRQDHVQVLQTAPLAIARSKDPRALEMARNMTVASEAAWVRGNWEIGRSLQAQRQGDTAEARRILDEALGSLRQLSEQGGEREALERPIREVTFTMGNLTSFQPGSLALKAAQLTNDACRNDNAQGIVQQDTYHFNGMHVEYLLE